MDRQTYLNDKNFPLQLTFKELAARSSGHKLNALLCISTTGHDS